MPAKKTMTETEIKGAQLGERVTALEHDVQTIGDRLEIHRGETRSAFESIQKRSDENFGQVWRSQEAIRQQISGLVEKVSAETEAISEKVSSGKQVNWQLMTAAAGLITVIIGLVSGGVVAYIHAKASPIQDQIARERDYTRELSGIAEKHAEEKAELRDQISEFRTASMIADAIQTLRRDEHDAPATK